jgi:hypothetical protein
MGSMMVFARMMSPSSSPLALLLVLLFAVIVKFFQQVACRDDFKTT